MADVENAQAEIGLLIYPDCQLAAVYGLGDLFRIANEQAQARLPASGDRLPPIRVSRWQIDEERGDIACVDDSHPGRAHRLSYVIAPPSIVMPERMRPMPAEAAWMNARHAEGSTLCSVCAGAFVLAETGLVDGRRATTHWAFADELGARFPRIELAAEHMVVDEGDIVTAGGILAWNDLGLILVERLMGPSVMLATARFLLIDPPRASQRPYSQFVPRLDHGDEAVRRAQHHLHAHAGEEMSITKLAGIAGLTERTFLRRFVKATGVKPIDYLQQTRIAKAREMLELTNQPVDRIAWTVGYADPAAFRKVFQKLTGLAPNVFRQRFGVRVSPS
ncbi:GlxA family transcriptional regulator [Aureimonas altamirensis]|uniref:GlxA family transcriptional regulator n=1 Tax=Aureimonas altamirensis TaxID=370622 RepID=UPI001E3E91E5|nr:GlxA family transcriptional regulator [Aureimonas altamirensis]UHD45741.1 GlxA family transcriptional regulator [Aureimonas altamirensis]